MTERTHWIKRSANWAGLVLGFASLIIVTGASGCRPPKLIDGVSTVVEPNLETVKVQLHFAKDVQSDIGGSFAVKDYGTIELDPSTANSPFRVGFRLNTSIVNDQDYIRFTPTRFLPSGQLLPIDSDRALVQVQMPEPVSKKFDVYAYVDVLGGHYLGVALTMKFLNQRNFPVGLSLSQRFVKGSSGNYLVSAAVFGPKVDDAGNLTVPGGIALLADARSLIDDVRALNGESTGLTLFSAPAPLYFFDGPAADHYRQNPRDAVRVTESLKLLLEQNDSRRNGRLR